MSGLACGSRSGAATVDADVRRGVQLVKAMYGLQRSLSSVDTRSSDTVDFAVDFSLPLPHARDGSHRVLVQLYRTVPPSLHRAGLVTACVEAVFGADYCLASNTGSTSVQWRHVEPQLARYVMHPASRKLLRARQHEQRAKQSTISNCSTAINARGDAVTLHPLLVMRLLCWVEQARSLTTANSNDDGDGGSASSESTTRAWQTPFLRDLAWLLRGWRSLELDPASLDIADDPGAVLTRSELATGAGASASGGGGGGSRATVPQRHHRHSASYHEAMMHDVASGQSVMMMMTATTAVRSSAEHRRRSDEGGNNNNNNNDSGGNDNRYDYGAAHAQATSSLRSRPLYRMATPTSVGTSSVLAPALQPMAPEATNTAYETVDEEAEGGYVYRTYSNNNNNNNNSSGSGGDGAVMYGDSTIITGSGSNHHHYNNNRQAALSMPGTMAAATTTRILHGGGSGVMSASTSAALRRAAASHGSHRHRPFAALLLPRGAVIAYGMPELVRRTPGEQAEDKRQLTARSSVRIYTTQRMSLTTTTNTSTRNGSSKSTKEGSMAGQAVSATPQPLPSLVELSFASPQQTRCAATMAFAVRRSAQAWREFTLYVSESQPHRALRANVALCDWLRLRRVAHLLQVLCRLARGFEQVHGITAAAYVADTLLPVLRSSVAALQQSRQPFWAGVAVCCLVLPEVLAMTAEAQESHGSRVDETQRPLLAQLRAQPGRFVAVVRLLERVLELNAAYSQMCEARLVRIALESRRSTTPALAATIARPSTFAQTAMTRVCAVCGLSLQPTLEHDQRHLYGEEKKRKEKAAPDTLQTLKARVTEGCLVVRCARCGHGGHVEHLIDWWKDTTVRCCPKGCDCVCLY